MSESKSLKTSSQPISDRIQRLHRLAFLLDNSISIPGTKLRFGLDPILGLLGVVGGSGDVVGGAVGAYIIYQAAQMGIPKDVVWQMVVNILLDSLVGIVPGLGDLLDFTWKANTRNMALVDQHLTMSSTHKKGNLLFVVGITLLTVLIVLGCALLTLLLIKTIFQL